MSKKDRHAKLNVGETIKAAYDERVAAATAKWDFRQLSPGYWGFVTPEGDTFCHKFKDEVEARTFVEDKERKRLIG
jgi:hypothetical protein